MARDAFVEHVFDLAAAQTELADFRKLLDSNTHLKEREQVLASFAKWPNLCALFGKFHGQITIADRIKREFRIEGYFRTDLTVKLAGRDHICLVEFEGASPNCIFKPGDRTIDDWAPNFEKGFSQIVDWAWAIDEYRHTPVMRDGFGSERPDFISVLVIGRDSALESNAARARWKWRSRHVAVHGGAVTLLTYDDLYFQFDTEIQSRL
ncbi:MAG: DUF4263 domain-containing protein [Alphaproteobacteria bacterium]|nr:DUF4263 domain-containing protein [Alphaproteobacteria bacterium]MBV9372778.1 DUF4263 domain-containing protein [Alphaproteobacteria bacterium]MBV9900215.1 DUF4263 domain-containing protein [Alphaproteobacteria bacterium]